MIEFNFSLWIEASLFLAVVAGAFIAGWLYREIAGA